MGDDFSTDWDEEAATETAWPVVDLEVDPLTIHQDDEDESPDEAEEPAVDAPDADLANLIVELVELVNARDMDTLVELLATDAESAFLGGTTPSEVIAGLEELIFRYPDLVLTRGDLGSTPVAGAWILDADTDHYRFAGMFTIELSETEQGLIGILDYVEEPPADDLVVEVPDDSERSEWDEWATLEES